jgi:hypothetical protein
MPEDRRERPRPARPVASRGENATIRDDATGGWVDVPGGTSSAVSRRGPWFRKRSRSDRAWRQERDALAALAGRVPSIPPVIDADARERTLILGRLAGAPADPTDARVHAAAGAWLARLHALPVADADPLPVCDALTRRAAAALARARGLLPDRRLAAIADRVGDLGARYAGPRRWCHRDFTPANWLQGPFGVVDFEHARPDLPQWDLVKLAAEVWPEAPALRTAFLDPYGDPGDLEPLCVLHGLVTYTWGRNHRDEVFTALGTRILDRCCPG